jgi:hypothetical protein
MLLYRSDTGRSGMPSLSRSVILTVVALLPITIGIGVSNLSSQSLCNVVIVPDASSVTTGPRMSSPSTSFAAIPQALELEREIQQAVNVTLPCQCWRDLTCDQ